MTTDEFDVREALTLALAGLRAADAGRKLRTPRLANLPHTLACSACKAAQGHADACPIGEFLRVYAPVIDALASTATVPLPAGVSVEDIEQLRDYVANMTTQSGAVAEALARLGAQMNALSDRVDGQDAKIASMADHSKRTK